MDGIINVNKEKGFTSFDVVAVLRGILHEKKIGHCGTLDPDAEGVLVVCTGHATKMVELLTAHEKTYVTKLLLGVRTDTQDTGGTVIEEKTVSVTEQEVRDAAARFTGDIMQLPPMYSAVKIDGKKLYELARAGKEAERKPRKVHISSISVDEIDLPYVTMTVTCSKGTYIRTLCEDIGNMLGCGGTMAYLCRIRSGFFTQEKAFTLDEIRSSMADYESSQDAAVPSVLTPLDACFAFLPSCTVTGDKDMLVRNGNPVRLRKALFEAPGEDVHLFEGIPGKSPENMVRVYLADGTFAGVYEYVKERRFYKPWKMFITAQQGEKKEKHE